MTAIEELEKILCRGLKAELEHFVWLQEHTSDLAILLDQQERVNRLTHQLEDLDAQKKRGS